MRLPDYEKLEASTALIQDRWQDFRPEWTCMFGSGWGQLAELFTFTDSIPYAQIPALGEAGVPGHAGQLTRATLADREFLLFEGRRHWYETADFTPVMFPMFLAAKLGVKNALLTNAAGGIRSDLTPGTIMVMKDHINLMGFNPLMGSKHPIWGEAFPDMTSVYDSELQSTLIHCADSRRTNIVPGVYCAFSGPSYETPAEIRMARAIGADAVGMSTVPSAILARAAGIKVLGISCISNKAAGLSDGPLHHQEVIDVSRMAINGIRPVLGTFFAR
jgi:purine-nucleoside phosphorylase